MKAWKKTETILGNEKAEFLRSSPTPSSVTKLKPSQVPKSSQAKAPQDQRLELWALNMGPNPGVFILAYLLYAVLNPRSPIHGLEAHKHGPLDKNLKRSRLSKFIFNPIRYVIVTTWSTTTLSFVSIAKVLKLETLQALTPKLCKP